MLKKVLWTVVILLVIAGLAVGSILPPSLLAANGYAAKWACSNVFVGERTLDQALDDLPDNPLLPFLDATLDKGSERVVVSVLGGFERVAQFRPGYGCTLVPATGQTRRLAPVPTPPPRAAAGPSWPGGDDAPFDHSRLDAAVDRAFTEDDPQRLKNTRAVVIVHHGAVVAERYAEGFTADTPLPGWSMTKSVLNALYGRAVALGKIDVEKPAPVEEWQDPQAESLADSQADSQRRSITIDQLLRMSSGLAFSEDYADLRSDAVRMLFVTGDAGGFAAAKPLAAPPDTTWQYSSGTSNLLSKILREVLGPEVYLDFPRQQLFEPLGMSSALIEPDASGTFVASSFGWATARDWARFGLLYLQDGVFDGQRLLPEGWVTYSTTPTPSAPRGLYGAQFWLNAGSPDNARDRRWPGLPADLYLASGFDGQSVVVVPSHDAVIVRLGLSQDEDAWQVQDFLAEVLAALPAARENEV